MRRSITFMCFVIISLQSEQRQFQTEGFLTSQFRSLYQQELSLDLSEDSSEAESRRKCCNEVKSKVSWVVQVHVQVSSQVPDQEQKIHFPVLHRGCSSGLFQNTHLKQVFFVICDTSLPLRQLDAYLNTQSVIWYTAIWYFYLFSNKSVTKINFKCLF